MRNIVIVCFHQKPVPNWAPAQILKHWIQFKVEPTIFETSLNLKFCNALAFCFTSPIHKYLFCSSSNIHFKEATSCLIAIKLKEIIGKILLDFCVRACTSWFPVNIKIPFWSKAAMYIHSTSHLCASLKRVFAKNERGYRLNAIKSAFDRY